MIKIDGQKMIESASLIIKSPNSKPKVTKRVGGYGKQVQINHEITPTRELTLEVTPTLPETIKAIDQRRSKD